MDRRRFLLSSLKAAAVGVASGFAGSLEMRQGSLPPRAPSPPAVGSAASDADFVEFGSPYRKSADRVAASAGLGRDRLSLREETVHHRMPPAWRDRLHLGIRG